jgi:hypothetical protein
LVAALLRCVLSSLCGYGLTELAFVTVGTSEGKIEALAEMICRAGDDPEMKSAALLVLMAAIENAAHPKALANAAKHLALTRCGELNAYDMVEAQVASVEGEILAGV